MSCRIPKHLLPILFLWLGAILFSSCHSQEPLGTEQARHELPDHYPGTDSLWGDSLKSLLNDLISEHSKLSYAAVYDALILLDMDPADSSKVIGIYARFSMDGKAKYAKGQGWNREHVWAKSRGDFATRVGAGTDLHHICAADVSTNSARNNRNFSWGDTPYTDQAGFYQGPTQVKTSDAWIWEVPDEVKGDVARMIFYMAVRYEGENGEVDLELTNEILDQQDKRPLLGQQSVLLEWHQKDPVSEAERRRNDLIYQLFQHNRNPFIDHPEFVERIWPFDALQQNK